MRWGLAPFAGLNSGESSAGHWGRCTSSQHHKQPLCLLIVTLRMFWTWPELHTAESIFCGNIQCVCNMESALLDLHVLLMSALQCTETYQSFRILRLASNMNCRRCWLRSAATSGGMRKISAVVTARQMHCAVAQTRPSCNPIPEDVDTSRDIWNFQCPAIHEQYTWYHFKKTYQTPLGRILYQSSYKSSCMK